MKVLLRKMRSLIKLFLLICFRPFWFLLKVFRRKNVWVFGAWYGKKYCDNSMYLFEYTIEHYPNIKCIWFTVSDEVTKLLKSKGYKVVHPNSFIGYYYSLICDYVFITNYWDDIGNSLAFGAKQILLYHGQGIKKIGYANTMENREEKETAFQKFKNHFLFSKLSKTYATLTTAPFFNEYLKQAWNISEEQIWQTGLPRCDVLFSNRYDSFVRKIRNKYPNSKIILYMPTFRMTDFGTGEEFTPFKTEYGFEREIFNKFLEDNNIVFLFKSHVVDANLRLPHYSERLIHVLEEDFEDLYVLLNSVDALITDYSSVYMDFLPTGKQIYLFTFDYEEYLQKSRELFFDIRKEFNGIYCNNWSDFYEYYSKTIDKGIKKEDIIKFACNNNGNSCEAICKRVMEIK